MFGGFGGALKDLSSKAEEMIEKTKTSVGEMAAEKKAAAAAMLEAQAQKTTSVLGLAKGNVEASVNESLTETKQAAIDGFDKEVEKVVEEGVQEKKEETKPVEASKSEEAKPSDAGFDPSKLLGGLAISGGLGGVDKEVEKVVDGAIVQVSTTIDSKMKEADQFVDEKREEVVKAVQEETTKATSSASEGFGAVLGKAKGLLNF